MTSEVLADLARVFSDLAPRFGLSRAAGACLAAIWRAAQAPAAEDLCTQLGLSRSNVSVALKELRQAGLVQVARSPGARRDFFVAEADPWALLRALIAERHRREIAPLLDRLAAFDPANPDPRLSALAQMAAQANDWAEAFARQDAASLARVMGTSPPAEAKKKKKKHREKP